MGPLLFNNLEVRLADHAGEIDAAQMLRYNIFYNEMGAVPSPECQRRGRDFDAFDAVCDHLLVIDHDRGDAGSPCVVGTYRLLRGRVAKAESGFYSESEFDLTVLKSGSGEILELGRSCIDPAYRRRGAMQLLWRGIATYLASFNIQVMFGCGSIHGTDPDKAARVLAYLHHFHRAPGHLRPSALAGRYVDMDRLASDRVDAVQAQAELPPLLKGYLRLGGYVGDGAVIDHDFNTIDVCVVVETARVTEKYRRHFDPNARWSAESYSEHRAA